MSRSDPSLPSLSAADTAFAKLIREVTVDNENRTHQNETQSDEEKDALPTPPANLPERFPPNFWDPYQAVPEPEANAVTSEFEAAFKYKSVSPSPIVGDNSNQDWLTDNLVQQQREHMRELYSNLDEQTVDAQVRKFMDELTELGEPPVYEDSFAALATENTEKLPLGALAAGLDDEVGELGDFAVNNALFDEFAQLLQSKPGDVDVDDLSGRVGPRVFDNEWAAIEKQVDDEIAGKLDLVSHAQDTKQAIEELLEENVESYQAEGGTNNEIRHEFNDGDPAETSYVFEEENEFAEHQPAEALNMVERLLLEAAPERVIDALEVALKPAPGRQELSDEKRAYTWYTLGIVYAEQGDSYHAVQCLQMVVNLARIHSELELKDSKHPLRLAARASVELAILYGGGMNTRLALSHIQRWLSLANEVWNETGEMMDDGALLNEDNELELTDALRQRVRKVLERHTGDADALKAASFLHTLARDNERALDALHGVADVCPKDALVWTRLAEVIGVSDDGLRARRKVVDLRPADPRAWALVGLAYTEMESHDKAAPYLLRALMMDEKLREEAEDKGNPSRRKVGKDVIDDSWSTVGLCARRLGYDELSGAAERREIEPFRAYFNF